MSSQNTESQLFIKTQAKKLEEQETNIQKKAREIEQDMMNLKSEKLKFVVKMFED